MEFYFQSNSVMNSLKCPKSKSLSLCLTEIFPFYQNNQANAYFKPCTSTVDGRGKVSNTFLLIFPTFLCLLSTKLMAKWSRVPSQLSWGQKLSTKVNFDIFSSSQFSKNPQIFKYFCSCAFLQISANLDFIAINLNWFKGPLVQFWSSCCMWFYLFLG